MQLEKRQPQPSPFRSHTRAQSIRAPIVILWHLGACCVEPHTCARAAGSREYCRHRGRKVEVRRLGARPLHLADGVKHFAFACRDTHQHHSCISTTAASAASERWSPCTRARRLLNFVFGVNMWNLAFPSLRLRGDGSTLSSTAM